MRKFMSIVTVLTLVLALAIPAFASGEGSPVVPGNPGATVEEKAKDETGKEVTIVVDEATQDPTPAQEEAAQKLAEEKAGADAKLGEPFDISVDGASTGDVTVVFTYTGTGDLAGVLYLNSDGNWDYAEAKALGNGRYEVVFEHFCTAMFVINPPKQEPSGSGSGSTSKPATSGSNGGKTSPQTGFDASVYMTVAMVLVLFAGFCFVKARKVTE